MIFSVSERCPFQRLVHLAMEGMYILQFIIHDLVAADRSIPKTWLIILIFPFFCQSSLPLLMEISSSSTSIGTLVTVTIVAQFLWHYYFLFSFYRFYRVVVVTRPSIFNIFKSQ